MSQLTNGYDQVKTALEDWIHVLQRAEEAATDPSYKLQYGLTHLQLQMVADNVKLMLKTAKELEDTLLSLGLGPRAVDTASLDALWGEDVPE